MADELNLVEWYSSLDEGQKTVLIKMAGMADSGFAFYNMSRMLLRGKNYNEGDLSLLLTFIRAVNGIVIEDEPPAGSKKKPKKKKKVEFESEESSEDGDAGSGGSSSTVTSPRKKKKGDTSTSSKKKAGSSASKKRGSALAVDAGASGKTRSASTGPGHKKRGSSIVKAPPKTRGAKGTDRKGRARGRDDADSAGGKRAFKQQARRAMSVSNVRAKKKGGTDPRKKRKIKVLEQSAVEEVDSDSDDDESAGAAGKGRSSISAPPKKGRKSPSSPASKKKGTSDASKKRRASKMGTDSPLSPKKKKGGTKKKGGKGKKDGSSKKKGSTEDSNTDTESVAESTTESITDSVAAEEEDETVLSDEASDLVELTMPKLRDTESGKADANLSKGRFSITVSDPTQVADDAKKHESRASSTMKGLRSPTIEVGKIALALTSPSQDDGIESLYAPESPMAGWGDGDEDDQQSTANPFAGVGSDLVSPPKDSDSGSQSSGKTVPPPPAADDEEDEDTGESADLVASLGSTHKRGRKKHMKKAESQNDAALRAVAADAVRSHSMEPTGSTKLKSKNSGKRSVSAGPGGKKKKSKKRNRLGMKEDDFSLGEWKPPEWSYKPDYGGGIYEEKVGERGEYREREVQFRRPERGGPIKLYDPKADRSKYEGKSKIEVKKIQRRPKKWRFRGNMGAYPPAHAKRNWSKKKPKPASKKGKKKGGKKGGGKKKGPVAPIVKPETSVDQRSVAKKRDFKRKMRAANQAKLAAKDEDAIREHVEELDRFPDDARSGVYNLNALANYARNPFNTDYMVDLDLVPILKKCLDAQKGEAALWNEADRWIKQAAKQRPTEYPALIEESGIIDDTCVDVLKNGNNDTVVASGPHACHIIDSILDNLASADTPACTEQRDRLVRKLVDDLGLVGVLEKIVEEHPSSGEICQAATGTLRRLQAAAKDGQWSDSIGKGLSQIRRGSGFKQDVSKLLTDTSVDGDATSVPVAKTRPELEKRWKRMIIALDKNGFKFDEGTSKEEWADMKRWLQKYGWPDLSDPEWRELEELLKKLKKSQDESWADVRQFIARAPHELCEPLLAAVLENPDNKFLSTHASGTLHLAAKSDPKYKAKLREGVEKTVPEHTERKVAEDGSAEEVYVPAQKEQVPGVAIVSEAMLRNPSYKPLRREGALLLGELVEPDEFQKVLDTLLDWSAQTDPNLRDDVGLLANLELIPENAKKAIDAGAVPAYMALIDDKMRKGMTAPLSEDELLVVERAVRGLGRLLNDPDAAKQFAKLNGMPQLQYVMKMYGEAREPIYNACNEALCEAAKTKTGKDACLKTPVGDEMVLKDCVLVMGRHPEFTEAFRDFRQVLSKRGDIDDAKVMGEMVDNGLFPLMAGTLHTGLVDDLEGGGNDATSDDKGKRIVPVAEMIRDTALNHPVHATTLARDNLPGLKRAVDKCKDSPEIMAHVLDAIGALTAANPKNHELFTEERLIADLEAMKDSESTPAATRKLIMNFMERIGKVMEDPDRGFKDMRQFFNKLGGVAAEEPEEDDGFRSARQFVHGGYGSPMPEDEDGDDTWKSMRQFYVNTGNDFDDLGMDGDMMFDDDYGPAGAGDAKLEEGVDDEDRRKAILKYLKDLNDAFEEDPEFAKDFVDDKKAKDILEAVQEFFDDPQIVYYGLDDLKHCCVPGSDAAKHLEDIGAVEAIGQCMLEHPEDGDVLLAGLQTLAKMADYAPEEDAMREAVTQPIINEVMHAAAQGNLDDPDFADAFSEYVNNLLPKEFVEEEPLQAANLATGLAEYGALETLYGARDKHEPSGDDRLKKSINDAIDTLEKLLFGADIDFSDPTKLTPAELALLELDDLNHVLTSFDNDQLMTMMKAAKGHPRLTKAAMNTLNTRLVGGGDTEEFHKDAYGMLMGRGGLEDLFQQAKDALVAENTAVEQAVLDTVGILSQDPRLRGMMAMHGLIPLILAVMRANPKDILLLDKCCYILANLAVSNDQNVTEIIELGGTIDLVSVLKRHKGCSFLCESALNVLVNCSHGSDRNKVIIARNDAGKASLAVIEKFVPKRVAEVKFAERKEEEPHYVALSGGSAPGSVVSLGSDVPPPPPPKKEKKSVKDPCTAAFRLLSNLAVVEDNVSILWKAKTVQKVMEYGKEGGIDCDSQEISHMSVVCLANISSHVVVAPHMCHMGVLQFILEMSRHWTDDLEIQKSCVGCIGNLLTNAASYTVQFLELKGAQRVYEIMSEMVFETDLMCLCFQLLKIVCSSPEIALRVARNGGSKACLETMEEYINSSTGEIIDPRVIKYGCQALAKMITSREVCKMVFTQNIVDTLEKVIKGHDYWTDLTLMSEAIKVCANFSMIEENAAAMTKRLGVSILKSVELHSTSGVFLSNVSLTLAKASLFRSCSRHLVKRGCVAVIVKSATLNPDRRDVIERYLKTLANFVYVEARAYTECLRTGALDIFQQMIATYHSGFAPIKREFDSFQRAMKIAESGGTGSFVPPPPGGVAGPRGSVSLARGSISVPGGGPGSRSGSISRRSSSVLKDTVDMGSRRAMQAGTHVTVHTGKKKVKTKIVKMTEDMMRLQMFDTFDQILEGAKPKRELLTSYITEIIDGNMHPNFMILHPSAINCCVIKGRLPDGKTFDTCFEFKSSESQKKWVAGVKGIIQGRLALGGHGSAGSMSAAPKASDLF